MVGKLFDCGAGVFRYELGDRAWCIADFAPGKNPDLTAVALNNNPDFAHEAYCGGSSVEQVVARIDEIYGSDNGSAD